jgi:ArsR family transcriptional regulator
MPSVSKPLKPPTPKKLANAADLFKALGDPHRLRLLALIAKATPDICVCDLNDGVPLLQPTVSHHLKVLRDAGLVTCERRATWMYYRLTAGASILLRNALAAALPRKA